VVEQPGPERLALAPEPAAVPAARRFVETRCGIWGVDREATASAALVTSELVTNAVRHAHTPIEVSLKKARGELMISVADASTLQPKIPPTELDRVGGLGLVLVAELSKRWGTSVIDSGKTVWAVIPMLPTSGGATRAATTSSRRTTTRVPDQAPAKAH
jgi:anti-sigma regulatory factor (Ser/Thr protein kinase)